MKLYHLFPKDNLPKEDNPWEPWYDKAFGFVIRAENEQQAREMADKKGGDETTKDYEKNYEVECRPWLESAYSNCVELTTYGDEEVIIMDFASA